MTLGVPTCFHDWISRIDFLIVCVGLLGWVDEIVVSIIPQYVA